MYDKSGSSELGYYEVEERDTFETLILPEITQGFSANKSYLNTSSLSLEKIISVDKDDFNNPGEIASKHMAIALIIRSCGLDLSSQHTITTLSIRNYYKYLLDQTLSKSYNLNLNLSSHEKNNVINECTKICIDDTMKDSVESKYKNLTNKDRKSVV